MFESKEEIPRGISSSNAACSVLLFLFFINFSVVLLLVVIVSKSPGLLFCLLFLGMWPRAQVSG